MHEQVIYSDNKLRVIPDEAFAVFPQLRSLNLSHNFIDEVSEAGADVWVDVGGVIWTSSSGAALAAEEARGAFTRCEERA